MTKELDGEAAAALRLGLLARLPGAVDLPGVAAKLQASPTSAGDPLDEVPAGDLMELLSELGRMRTVVEDQQDRVLAACHRRSVSLRTLAALVGLNSPEAVRKRLNKARARVQGDEAETAS